MILLVADTNLFFECKPLDQLPWQELDPDQVVIILTKPVLDEIDKHKKGTGRTRDRALEIFGRVREMLTTSTKEYEIRASSPRVVLRRAPNEKPDPAFASDLDYARNDERLVGIIATIATKEAGHDVRLFTDDTGPAATADGLGVRFLMINPAWRRPPAETTEVKRIKALEKDLDTYRSQEPVISIDHPEGAGEANRIAVTRKVVTPLTQDEIDGVLDALRAKHPLREDFAPPPTKSGTTASGATKTTEYLAPGEAAINDYRDGAYPRWIENCRDVLAKLHEGRDEIEPRVVLRWPMSNRGTRPATRVRVEFEAKGYLELRRLANEADDEDASSETPPARTAPAARFPPPPAPPGFEERVTHSPAPVAPKPSPSPGSARILGGGSIASLGRPGLSALDSILGPGRALEAATRSMTGVSDYLAQTESLRRAGMFDNSVLRIGEPGGAVARAMESMNRFGDPSSVLGASAFSPTPIDIAPIIRPHVPKAREPEAFYYDWPLHETVRRGALTCDLWRHHSDVEIFDFEVLFTKDGEVRGSVECRVHAENLTKPQEARAVVSRSIETVSVLDLATAMVAACG